MLALGADPQMPAIQEEVDAVFLRRDGEVVRLANDLEMLDVDLVPAWCPLVGPGCSGDDDRGFLGEVIGCLEHLVADGRLRHDALDEAAAVPQDQKMNLPARAARRAAIP